MKKTALLIVGLMFLAQVVSAQQPDMPPMQQGNHMVKALKLTPDQEKKVQELNFQHQKAMVDVKAKIEKNQIELKKLVLDGNIDEKKLLQLTSDNSKLQAEMKEMGVKKWIGINKMLDKDQKEIWAKHLLRMGAGMKMMKEGMKDGARKMMMEHRMQNRRGEK
ncbi:MAG: periplasmic heavy metal sensor [Ignavibacteria bacterium]|nr:periplasmic heavy metal sensor [Ignavibacteria bacterium]